MATYYQQTEDFIEDYQVILPGGPTREFIARTWRNRSGRNRPAKLWTDANKGDDRFRLYIIFWVAHLLRYEVDHITPQSKGGSYHHSNLRIVPKSVNRMMSDNGWSNDELNAVIADIGPTARVALGIPADFVAMNAWELVDTAEWATWYDN